MDSALEHQGCWRPSEASGYIIQAVYSNEIPSMSPAREEHNEKMIAKKPKRPVHSTEEHLIVTR
jgi:hypothetical protein